MSLEDLRNQARTMAAIVALLVFMVDVWSQTRNRAIENIARFNEVHQRLFDVNGYLASNVKAIEDGSMQRDPAPGHGKTAPPHAARDRAAGGPREQQGGAALDAGLHIRFLRAGRRGTCLTSAGSNG